MDVIGLDLSIHNLVIAFLTLVSVTFSSLPNVPPAEKSPEFWVQKAKAQIAKRADNRDNYGTAKNVILFIGDGMGLTTVTAARILKGQLKGNPGEDAVLAFEEFPHVALSKTYNVDRQTPDSAGTATAILSGIKTNYYILGLDARATFGVCPNTSEYEVSTILNWAQSAGKRTGIVTTARITHATPAAAYAHAADRDWEGDTNIETAVNCSDIAKQLIDNNKDINVIMGGGRQFFLPNTTLDPETGTIGRYQRQDGRDLTKDWDADKKARKLTSRYVFNKSQFDAIDPSTTDYVLGLFEVSHMQYELERNNNSNGEPSLAEMTRKSIQILQRGKLGYFLLVEGGRIDHGHHENLAKKALYETLSMEDAIVEAVKLTSEDDTLIIVTADHSHVFDISGYPYRGSNIFGLVQPVAATENTTDNKPYTILHYANGPSAQVIRANLTGVNTNDNNFAFPSAVPMTYETHGGEDVAIYARGPMSHLFYGVQEQSYIAHVMGHAMCVGPYYTKCDRPVIPCVSDANKLMFSPFALLLILAYCFNSH